MPEPNEAIANVVLDNIASELGLIRKEDGYWFDVYPNQVTKEIKDVEEISNSKLPFIQIIPSDSVIDPAEMPNRDDEIFEVLIDGLILQTNKSLVDRDRERSTRDIRKKLMEDTYRGLNPVTGAPLARWTKIVSVERFDASTGFEGHAAYRITIEIQLRYDQSSP